MIADEKPQLILHLTAQRSPIVSAKGSWVTDVLAEKNMMDELQNHIVHLLSAHPVNQIQWDLSQIKEIDHNGAALFLRLWSYQIPSQTQISHAQLGFFERLIEAKKLPRTQTIEAQKVPFGKIGKIGVLLVAHFIALLQLFGQLVLDLKDFLRHPNLAPWKEISANIFKMGYRALPITALVGLLTGVVLSYLSAQQLRNFGGDLFIVNLLGMSIIRELGPMLAAILVAGRSGSSITAQLGVMQVTEEIDAMRVMGIPISYRLIFPKVIALAIAMPLIIVWTNMCALLGGALSAHAILDMPIPFFIYKLSDAVNLVNFWIGLGKGVVFGILIATVACHFGLRIKPNTESLGHGTTNSVVIAITVVIIADAAFAVAFSKVF